MSELTLESLAKRVEELERRVGGLPPGATVPEPRYTVRPGTGDWATVAEAVANITDYDYDALPAMDAASIARMKQLQERWNDPDGRERPD